MILDEIDFKLHHEAAEGEPEIVADEQQALHACSVALPEPLNEFASLGLASSVEPLLELIDDQQQLGAFCRTTAAAEGGKAIGEGSVGRQLRIAAYEFSEHTCFRSIGCSFHIGRCGRVLRAWGSSRPGRVTTCHSREGP